MKIRNLFVVALFTLGIGLCNSNKVMIHADEGEEITSEVVEVENPSEEIVIEEQPKENKLEEVEDVIKDIFSPTNIAMCLSWVAYIGTILGLVANIKKLKASNNLTLKNVSDEVKKVLGDEISKKVDEHFNAVLPNLLMAQEKSNKIMVNFAKILALSQENSPESRVAILNIVQELGIVANELVESSKKVVEETQKAIEEHKEEVNKAADEIISKYDAKEEYDGTSI